MNNSIFANYEVSYLRGLPENNKIIHFIQMSLTDNAFVFKLSTDLDFPLNLFNKKKEFKLSINYSQVKNFELIKGSGSALGANLVWDGIRAKLFEITYLNENNKQICVCFEMDNQGILSKNKYKACEELVRIMKNHGIFDKFISNTQQTTSTPDIPAQIQKLAELNQSGALTDDEFQAKKAELLKRL